MAADHLTYVDAAERVLVSHSKGAPMHYRQITQVAISEGLIKPSGKTPEQTMVAAITQEIKRRERTGIEQRFRIHGGGMYGLARPTDPLGGAIDEKNTDVKRRLKARLAELEPHLFETLIAELLAALGFEDIEVTKRSADGGIDVRGVLAVGGITDILTAIQVKRWSKNVSSRVVRELRGALGPHEQGLIITLSKFTSDARNEASAPNRVPIGLVDGDRLLDLFMENEIGVTRKRVTIYELDESHPVVGEAENADPLEQTGKDFQTPSPDGPVDSLFTGSEKAQRVWPLPGGRTAWKDTLDKMLRYVANEAPTMEEAVRWLIESYERTSSEKTARGYWRVPRSFGLMQSEGEQLSLTSEGAAYISDLSPKALLKVLKDRVLGFAELLHFLQQRPHGINELLERFQEEVGVSWETDIQIDYRLGWLENLGAVVCDGKRWRLASPDNSFGVPTQPTLEHW